MAESVSHRGVSLRAIALGMIGCLTIAVGEPYGVLVMQSSPMAADYSTGAALFLFFLVTLVIRTHGTQVRTGTEGLVNLSGVARTDLAPQGKVFVHGEIWNAVAEEPISAGASVQVVAVEGIRLRVRSEA